VKVRLPYGGRRDHSAREFKERNYPGAVFIDLLAIPTSARTCIEHILPVVGLIKAPVNHALGSSAMAGEMQAITCSTVPESFSQPAGELLRLPRHISPCYLEDSEFHIFRYC
jgi:hypothetical protein